MGGGKEAKERADEKGRRGDERKVEERVDVRGVEMRREERNGNGMRKGEMGTWEEEGKER